MELERNQDVGTCSPAPCRVRNESKVRIKSFDPFVKTLSSDQNEAGRVAHSKFRVLCEI